MGEARARSWRSVTADAALTIAAALGAVCIALVIAAALFDVRIILFSTGSMSPAIPAGSAAIVRGIPAADVSVGDVITVERPGQLPITHRVTSVESVPGGAPEQRRLTMRGDANRVDDPFPYDVSTVRLVVWSVPGVAPAIAAMGNPWVLGIMTVAATTLVVWVFWPRRPGSPVVPSLEERPGAGLGTGAARAVIALVVIATVWAPPDAAHAAGDVRVVQGDVIRLVSITEPRMADLAPGTSAVWQVGVMADAPSPGTITVQLSSGGDRALGLRYIVEVCSERWTGLSCPTARTVVAEGAIPLDRVERDVLSMAATDERWLRVLVTRAEDSRAEASGAVDITVRAVGLGDDVATSPVGALPATGAVAPWTLAAAGIVLLAIGGGIAARSRRRAP